MAVCVCVCVCVCMCVCVLVCACVCVSKLCQIVLKSKCVIQRLCQVLQCSYCVNVYGCAGYWVLLLVFWCIDGVIAFLMKMFFVGQERFFPHNHESIDVKIGLCIWIGVFLFALVNVFIKEIG